MFSRLFFPFIFISFLSFSQGLNSNKCNCCSEVYKQFDFWVGDWVVMKPDGSKAGVNTIVKQQDSCVLQEQWISSRGNYTGTSYNFYNGQLKQWEQIWIDNQGGSLHLKGERKGNLMILRSDELVNADGKPFFHRITWTNNSDGTVRQLWETINEGSEIQILFDGLYTKKISAE